MSEVSLLENSGTYILYMYTCIHVLHSYAYIHVRVCTFLAGVTVCTEPGSMPSIPMYITLCTCVLVQYE